MDRLSVLDAMKDLIPHYESYFDDSEYKHLMFKPDFKWHFAKAEPYKHYFVVFYKQVKSLPVNQMERIDFVRMEMEKSIATFREVQDVIYLDENSDGSHLPTWLNVIKSFQKSLI